MSSAQVTDALGAPHDAAPRPGDLECLLCNHGWDPDTLYKTGDVLRCPNCDGVLRP